MKCPGCQTETPSDAAFCPMCGANLTVVCAQCGTANAPDHNFCKRCGHPLAPAAGQLPAATRFTSPESYTPKHLAEKILTSKSALEGERKQVTVLFADLKGSMELLADRDPEEARKLLDPVLELMMEAVHRYEGTVNQVMGDGIMALFGAPLAHEDHAVRACYAALRMQEAVRRYAEGVRRTEGIPIQIRVGLNSGEVVVRAIGSDLHMDYTAVGQTTHLAARMEQAAVPGSTLLPAATLRLAEGYIQVKPLGPIPVKGLSEPVDVYELLRAGPVRSRLHAAAARGLTPFVGREAELEGLRQALERAQAGRGQVVGLVGEPGVGKSRLVWEFTRSHRTHGWLILETRSASYGKATLYLPILDLLKAYFQIEDRDDGRKIREKVTGKLLTLDPALQPTLPAFLAFLEVPVEDGGWQALDPLQRRQRTLEAVKRLLLRESQVQPLLLILEDLHWIDAETQALLDSLIESLPTARVLLLVNYRPEYRHGWGSKTYYTQLRLDPLPPTSAEELLQALLGANGALAALKRLLIQRTQGNPLFLEESVRTLLETQVLVGERGAYRLAKALPAIQVPPTVRAVLAARIDRLPPEEKRLLQAAAVIGEEVPFPLLQAIAEEPEEALRLRLAHLQAAEFLYEASLFPDLAYTFKHGLTYQVAYQSLLQDRRRALHARVVEAIERLYPDRLTDHIDQLAHHVVRGEVWDKAIAYLRPVTTVGPPPVMAASPWWRGHHDRAVELSQSDLSAAKDFKHFGLQVVANFHLGQAYHSLGDYPRATDVLSRNLRSLEGDLLHQRFGMPGLASVFCRTWLVWCLMEQGEFGQGTSLAAEAVELAEAANDPYSRIVAYVGLGGLHLLRGEVRKAIPVLERGRTLEQEANIPVLTPFTASPLGYAYALSGRVSDAVPLLEQAVEQAAATEFMANQSLRIAWLSEAYLLSGRRDDSAKLGERALQLSREHKERGNQAHVLRHLGEVASHHDRPEAENPENHYRQAMSLAEELGMRPLLARCHLGLGKFYRRTEESRRAQEHLTIAITLFRQMDMSFWLQRAAAELERPG